MANKPHPHDVQQGTLSWRALYEEARLRGDEWKQRAEQAEAESARLRQLVADLSCPRCGTPGIGQDGWCLHCQDTTE